VDSILIVLFVVGFVAFVIYWVVLEINDRKSAKAESEEIERPKKLDKKK